ncbi:probable indole-3-pyruvate monooxygenase YUCCA10 [Zingiber officinale]|uniref:probable indole-3-pyruvate monooxygenase YUCCA10 n=1 Tax=Zingiber officinale TaxID=94328 RepID=UPI001C4AFE0C|nr:probable indole-3-pyruvate monooxygenase YUCCA10 [Zingiber officinale]
MTGETRTEVVIVGGGPAGLATSACLNVLSVPNVVLEREACTASLWKLRAYDRLKLHLAKRFCELPHMPFPAGTPTFVPRKQFLDYLTEYERRFALAPVCSTLVERAAYSDSAAEWRVTARDVITGELRLYRSRFLVVATGENSQGFIPSIPGLKSFPGDVLHSTTYKSGRDYAGKRVLVVGSGNSGMEIAYDLCNHGAETSIVIRAPVHLFNKELIYLGMTLLKYLPVAVVDAVVLLIATFKYGDMSKHGIVRPAKGPFRNKIDTGRSAIIDVGTVGKIKSGEIKVVKGEIKSIKGNELEFTNGETKYYDHIVFATGFRSTAKNWLKDDDNLMDADGMPKEKVPNHWKAKKGLYCAGFARSGLAGVAMDAQNVANDIKKHYA